jgi:ABC-type amino acid transport substrate-binding protein
VGRRVGSRFCPHEPLHQRLAFPAQDPPLSSIDSSGATAGNERFSGFAVDVWQAIADRLGRDPATSVNYTMQVRIGGGAWARRAGGGGREANER